MNRHCLLACSIAAGAVLSAPLGAQTVIAVQPAATVQIVPVQSQGGAGSSGQAAAGVNARSSATSGSATMMPEITVQQSSSGTAYISGGASTDVREAMDRRRSEFPLKVSVSACSGQYIVADQLTLSGSKGEFLSASDVGPIVMVKPPGSGKVTASATYKGETQTRSFSANTRQTVNICFKTKV